MSVKIRLMRMGKKKAPFYRIVAANSRSPRDGKLLEIIGFYNPIKDPPEIHIEEEKLKKWIERGAQLTDAVKSLLKKK